MKVLLIGPYPPPHGGVQTHLVLLRNFLRKRGLGCAVINITRHRRPDADEVYYPHNALQLLQLLLGLRYDVIHLHFGGNLSLRLLGLTLVCCLIPRAKTVLTFHSGGYPTSPVGKAAHRWSVRGFVLRRLDRIVGVNPELVDMFRRFGVPPERVVHIPPHAGLRWSVPDTAASVHEDRSDRSLRDFFDSHDPVVLTVGGLETEYGLPLQIDMLGSLRTHFPEAGLAIIGGGSLEREIRECIETKEYRQHVLLCGDVPHARTLEAIGESDLMLRITAYDGDSIAVREAIGLGTPVLATNNGMRPPGVHLTSETSPSGLARAVEACLARPRSERLTAVEGDDQNLEAVLQLYVQLTPDLRSNFSSTTTVAG